MTDTYIHTYNQIGHACQYQAFQTPQWGLTLLANDITLHVFAIFASKYLLL